MLAFPAWGGAVPRPALLQEDQMDALPTQAREETAASRWARFSPIITGDDYVNSLRGRDVTVYLFGEKLAEPVDHPIIRPSINA